MSIPDPYSCKDGQYQIFTRIQNKTYFSNKYFQYIIARAGLEPMTFKLRTNKYYNH